MRHFLFLISYRYLFSSCCSYFIFPFSIVTFLAVYHPLREFLIAYNVHTYISSPINSLTLNVKYLQDDVLISAVTDNLPAFVPEIWAFQTSGLSPIQIALMLKQYVPKSVLGKAIYGFHFFSLPQ